MNRSTAFAEQLRRKVRGLNEAVRRRTKRIATLQDALNDCRKQNILSDEAHDSLTDSFHPVAEELILNEVWYSTNFGIAINNSTFSNFIADF